MSEFDFDEENDFEDAPAALPQIDTSGVTITLPPDVLHSLVHTAAHRIDALLKAKIMEVIGARMGEIITETFNAQVGEIATAAVQNYLTKPRQKTSSWGEPSGPVTTMSDIIPATVESWLTEKVDSDGRRASSGYGDKYPTRFDWILTKHVRDQLTAETKAAAARVTEEAKKVVSASVGRFIADQLVPQIDVSRRA
jgi:hypothetical protein